MAAEPVVTPVPEPWLIHFFRRHRDDDPARPVPTIDFLNRLPDKIAAEAQAVLEAVAAAPPPSFSGRGKWEAMHDGMAGFYEVRVRGGAYRRASQRPCRGEPWFLGGGRHRVVAR